MPEAVELLPGRLDHLGRILRVLEIGERLAAHLLQHFAEVGVDGVRVRPGDIENLLGESAALLLVESLHGEEDARDDFLIGLGETGRIERFPLPLQPARGVGEGAVLLREVGRREHEDFGGDLRRRRAAVLARRLPEGGRLGLDILDDNHPLQFRQRGDHLLGVRPEADRVHAERDETFGAGLLSAGPHGRAAVHVIVDVHPRVVAVDLRQPAIAPVVVLRRCVAVERLQHRDHELRVVLPVVHRRPGLFVERGRHSRGVVVGQRLQLAGGSLEIAGKDLGVARGVGGPLDVRVPAEGIHAAARPADVAEKELQHCRGADDLDAGRVLRPSERVGDRADALGVAGGGHDVAHFEELRLRCAADTLDGFGRVAVDMLLE